MKSADNKRVMEIIFRLFGCDLIFRDSGFYLMNGVLSANASKNLTKTRLRLVKQLAEMTDDILDCLNVPKHALYAPIAADYEKYNS